MNASSTLPRIYLIGGLTGSGKTELLHHLSTSGHQVIDLEKMCHHDGSAFARLRFEKQPSAYTFNKQLNKTWLGFSRDRAVFIENERQRIGHIKIPDWLYERMREAPVIWLNTPRELRLQRLGNIVRCADPVVFCDCISKLSLHLGNERVEHILEVFSSGAVEKTIELLLDYYDHSEGYAMPGERVILQFEVTSMNMRSNVDVLLAAFSEKMSLPVTEDNFLLAGLPGVSR